MTPRSTTSLALACLLLVGCGRATSTPVADDPEPTAPTETSSATRPLDDFPLARGYPDTNGDDGSPVVVTDESGVAPLTFCDRPAWSLDVPVAPADVVGATYTGEAEDVRGRTLVRYDDEGLAAKALATLRLRDRDLPRGGLGRDRAGVHRDHSGPPATRPSRSPTVTAATTASTPDSR